MTKGGLKQMSQSILCTLCGKQFTTDLKTPTVKCPKCGNTIPMVQRAKKGQN
jgi:DNA-directed RNA polymerase subunit RPC12/RpoP